MRSYRSTGNLLKINLALSGLPDFPAAAGETRALAGFIHIGPDLEYLERAFDASKYGNWSPRPHLEVVDSVADRSGAGTLGRPRDVDRRAICSVSPS